MGAAASTLGATSGDVGKFRLSPAQKKYLDIVSNLFQLLLRKNNLMNLSELMSSKENACSDLIITLSDKLDKEFQRLQFTTSIGEATRVSFISDDLYQRIQKSDVRRDMCNKIAAFLLQFVVLVAALTASIAITDRDPSIKQHDAVLVPMEKENGQELTGPAIIDPRALSYLKDTRVIKEVTGSRGDVFEVGTDTYIHKTGLLYKAQFGNQGVFDINIDFVTSEYFRTTTTPGLSTQGYSSAGPVSTSRPFYDPEGERERIRYEEELKARKQLSEKELELKYEKERAGKYESRIQIVRMQKEASVELLSINNSLKEIDEKLTFLKNIFNPTESIGAKIQSEILKQRKESITANSELISEYGKYQSIENTINRDIKPLKKIVEEYINKDPATINMDDFKKKYEVVKGFDYDNAKRALENIIYNFRRFADDNEKYPNFKQVITAVQEAAISSASSTVGQRNQTGGANEFLEVTISLRTTKPSQSYTSLNTSAPYNSYNRSNSSSSYSSSSSAYSPSRNFPRSIRSASVYQGGANGEVVSKFIIDLAGNVYDEQFFRRSLGRVSRDQRSGSFSEKLESIISKYKNQTENYEIRDRFASQQMKIAQQFREFGGDYFSMKSAKIGIIEPLLEYFRTELDKSNLSIQSPAAQRAYLLSSGVVTGADNKTRILSKVCDDPWSGKGLSTVPAYSLFKAIQKNLTNDPPTSISIANPKFPTLLGNHVEEDSTDTLWKKKFRNGDLYDEVHKTFCSQTGVESKPGETVIKTAYRKLQQLYSQQIQDVLQILNQLFVVSPAFESTLASASGADTTEPILQLHPMFLTQNAQVYLEQVSKRAIEVLDKHYAEVENTYSKAITDMEISIRTSKVPTSSSASSSPSTTPTQGGAKRTRRRRNNHRNQRNRKSHRYNSFRMKRVARR